MTEVPCNGCTACCVGLTVHLDPDEVERFPVAVESRRMNLAGEFVGLEWFLPQDETGRCVYSVGGGCEVHAHKPRVCASFDCRTVLARFKAQTKPRLDILAAAEARL